MTLPNPGMTFTPFDPLTAAEMMDLVENIEALAAGTGFTSGVIPISAMGQTVADGWFPASETWTYATADTAAGGATSTNGVSTYTFTISGDKTGKYTAGMRLKLTQTTDKFFIITKVAHATGTTTITCFGGIDYSLANAAITNPYYSPYKAPLGFPLNPSKWTVVYTDASTQTQSTPAQNTYYNPGSIQITVPIGDWEVSAQTVLVINKSASTAVNARVGLSTANNAAPITTLQSGGIIGGASGTLAIGVPVNIYGYRNVPTTKEPLYLVFVTFTAGGATSVIFDGSFGMNKLVVKCAYL